MQHTRRSQLPFLLSSPVLFQRLFFFPHTHTVLLSLTVLLCAAALAASKTVRRAHPRDWQRVDGAVLERSATTVEFRLALTQSAEGKATLARETLERAEPSSDKYAEWLSQDAVLDLVAPAAHVTDLVVQYCEAHGLTVDGEKRREKKTDKKSNFFEFFGEKSCRSLF
jgi:hypothetical protein